MATTYTIQAGSRSAAIAIPAGAFIKITAAVTAYSAEYSLNSAQEAAGGLAVWVAWTGSPLSPTETANVAAQAMLFRVSASSGSVVVSVDESGAGASALTAIAWRNSPSLIGANGNYKALLVGDSIGAYSEVILSSATVTDLGNGTANVFISGGHGCAVGQVMRLAACPSVNLNSLTATVLSTTDSTNAIVQLNPPFHSVTSSAGHATVAFRERRNCMGFLTTLETRLGIQFDTTWAAIGGATSRAALNYARQAASGPYFVSFVSSGMNDIYSAGNTFAQCQADLKALIDYAASVSLYVVVLTVPPRDSGGGSWSAGKQTVHNQLNKWIEQYVRSIGKICINTWRTANSGVTYVNGAAANPDPTALMTIDGTHPSWPGALAIGDAIYTALSPLVGVDGYKAAHPSMIGADAGNILTDSDFSTGASTATGWAITNQTASTNVTPTLAARTVSADGDAAGRNQVITFDYGTAAGTASFRFARSASIHSLLTAGQMFEAVIPFSLTGSTGVTGVDILFQGTIGGGQTWQVYGNNLSTNVDPLTGAVSGYIRTPPTMIPSGITACTPFIRATFTSAQSGSAVLKLWHPVFRVYAP